MRASFNAPAVFSDHHNMLTYARTVGGTTGGKLLGEYLGILYCYVSAPLCGIADWKSHHLSADRRPSSQYLSSLAVKTLEGLLQQGETLLSFIDVK